MDKDKEQIEEVNKYDVISPDIKPPVKLEDLWKEIKLKDRKE